MADGSLPFDVAAQATMPSLVMDGGKTEWHFMRETADALSKAMPRAIRRTLPDQTHEVSADALAPVLKEFYESPAASLQTMLVEERPAHMP